ncbi:hypothetical protein V6N13_023191 [Hibiscus sabdariffa]
MAGRVFLLEFEDNLVYSSLKDSRWTYLKDVFTEFHPWSDSFRTPEMVVWLEFFGVPLHCWNRQTFRRIAEIHDEFLKLGENYFQSFRVEKMTILISISQIEKIDTIIDVEVGDELFLVRISKIASSREKFAISSKNGKGKVHVEKKSSVTPSEG